MGMAMPVILDRSPCSVVGMAGKKEKMWDLFGTRLKCLRKDRGETQKDLADFLGIKQNQIGEMENGRKASTFAKLALLCEHYNISADYLLGLTDEPWPLRQDDGAGR